MTITKFQSFCRAKWRPLALALCCLLAAPLAHAGQTCNLNDGNAMIEDDGGSSAGNGAVACGFGNSANGDSSSAFGSGNAATGVSSTATGIFNIASGNGSSAMGFSSTAAGENSVAVGNVASAIGIASVSLGSFFDANGNGIADSDIDTDLDGNFESSSELTTAFGDHSTAIGPGAWGVGDRSAALGAGSFAEANDSVAIGSGSYADRPNTVSVGAAGAERQITNVAAGTQATDAVNVQQMQTGDAQTLSAAKAYTDQKFAGLNQIENQVGVLDRRLNRVGALSAAMSLATPDARVGGANQFSMGLGHYRGQEAVSASYSRLVSPRAAVRVSAAFAGSDSAAGVGFNVGW